MEPSATQQGGPKAARAIDPAMEDYKAIAMQEMQKQAKQEKMNGKPTAR
jgi:hypothetical protein